MESERRKFGMVLIFAVLFAMLAFVSAGCASAATIYVPDNYTKIQWAVDNATASDTIIVKDGTYSENVNVNKRLTIESENGSANCIVQAASTSDHVFEISADYVTISGFTVKGAGKAGIYLGNEVDHCIISDNNASNNEYGIYLWSSSNNTLTSNTANSNNYRGIYLSYSSNNTLTSNTANSNNYRGIYLSYSSNNTLTSNTANSNNDDGIYLYSSSNNTLTSNTANSNTDNGIYLYYSSNYNTLTSNTAASNNEYGIYLSDSSNNTLTSNTASNNWGGISLSSSSNNMLTNNTASNNRYNYNGICLLSSSNNTLTNNTVNSNTNVVGIWLQSSSYNNLTGNTANNNDGGIYLCVHSSYNTLTNNIANSNNYDGIRLFYSSNNNSLFNNTANSNNGCGIYLADSSNNTLTNNYFNNTNNAYDDGNNIWNISKTEGTNIVGGPYLGGNYWSDYSGADTNGDGFGDTLLPYNSSRYIQNGGDYLPLVKPALPIFDTSTGTYPSIMGTHEGKIIPSHNLSVSRLYTYPSAGTGGHTKSIELEENGVPIANGTWNGYHDDYHNITIHNVCGALLMSCCIKVINIIIPS